MKAHLFFDQNNVLRLIPEEVLAKIDKATEGFHIHVEVTEAKANALPVVNPELLKDGVFMHRKDIDDFVNGKLTELYEWPGTWEKDYYNAAPKDEPSEPEECARLIAPQQPQADTFIINGKTFRRSDQKVKDGDILTCVVDGQISAMPLDQQKTKYGDQGIVDLHYDRVNFHQHNEEYIYWPKKFLKLEPMTQSDAPNEGREEITAEVFFKAEVDRQWLKRSGFSSDPGSISRIPFVIYPAMFKVMNDYADLKNSELRDQLSKEREIKRELLDWYMKQLVKKREMRKELTETTKALVKIARAFQAEIWEKKRLPSNTQTAIDNGEAAIEKASELDKT